MSDIIYTYTRKEAIEDGIQFLATGALDNIVKRYYKSPMYITDHVHNFIENQVGRLKKLGADYAGILNDILFFARMFPVELSPCLIKFKTPFNKTLFIQCGSVDTDDPSPCLTLMMELDL